MPCMNITATYVCAVRARPVVMPMQIERETVRQQATLCYAMHCACFCYLDVTETTRLVTACNTQLSVVVTQTGLHFQQADD